MDSLKGAFNSLSGGNNQQGQQTQQPQAGGQSSSGGGGFLGGIGDKFNSAAGGGQASEKNEDYLDKVRRQYQCLRYYTTNADACNVFRASISSKRNSWVKVLKTTRVQ
jgi:hypothetical protein